MVFDGIVSGDPAMRAGLSNLAMGKWIPVAFNQIAPKDADGKPIIAQAISDLDRKLITDALLQKCDAKDGVADGIISDPLGCDFDPAALTCNAGKSESCLTPEKVAAIKKAVGGPKTCRRSPSVSRLPVRHGHHWQRSHPRDSVAGARYFRTSNYSDGSRCREGSTCGYSASRRFDVHQPDDVLRAWRKADLLRRDSDPWFSPLDTFGYYRDMSAANGGPEAVSKWSQFYFVPGMAHCGGGPGLDEFDLLSALVNWVEKGTVPTSVIATGNAFPGRSRPLCPYPKHAHYEARAIQDANNYECH